MDVRRVSPAGRLTGQPQAGGHPYRTSSIAPATLRVCRQAGVANATFHDLRHTFVTNTRLAGVEDFHIMAITGHEDHDGVQTVNTVDEHDLRQAMQQIDFYLDTKRTG